MITKIRLHVAAALACVSVVAFAGEPRDISIPAGALAPALESLAKESGLMLIFRPEDLRGVRTQGVNGKLSPEEAVAKLISGTALTMKTDAAGAIVISQNRTSAAAPAKTLRVAQANPAPSEAQSASTQSPVLDEIVVTAPNYVSTGARAANKSDIPLVETPQSITVVSRDMIDLLKLGSLNEAMRYVSGAVGEAYGPDERYDWLTVRGFNPVQFIDGVQAPIASVNNTGTDLYGFESVEILKGPASALYGQSPPGGIVNMTSRRPKDRFGGELQVQGGEYDLQQINADITGPLSDRVSARLTALYRDRGTQVDYLESERLFISPSVAFDIGVDTTLTLLANYQRDELENQSTGYLPAYGTMLPNPLGKVPVNRNLGETGVNFFDRTQYSFGYSFSHRFNDYVTLEQNARYSDVDVESRAIYGGGLVDDDLNGVPDDYRTVLRYDFPFNEQIESTSVDTRASLRFATGGLEHSALVGVDYRHYVGYSEFGFDEAPRIDLFAPVYNPAAINDDPTIFPFLDETREQTGIYLQDQIKAGRLIVTLSGRQDYLSTETGTDKTSLDELSYRAGVNYVFDSGFTPYVQAAKSFQPLAGADRGGTPFDPTTGTQVEAGLKWDGRNLPAGFKLFASAAAYRIVQQNILTEDPVNPIFRVQTGEAEVKGIELEASARFRERLSFNVAYTTVDTEITENITTFGGASLLGKQLVAVPKTVASFLVDYTLQTGTFAGFGAGVGLRYRGEQYGDDLNTFKSDAVTMYDAIVHYDSEKWRFALNASNFTDKIFVDRCSDLTSCYYGTRRLVTASLTRKL